MILDFSTVSFHDDVLLSNKMMTFNLLDDYIAESRDTTDSTSTRLSMDSRDRERPFLREDPLEEGPQTERKESDQSRGSNFYCPQST